MMRLIFTVFTCLYAGLVPLSAQIYVNELLASNATINPDPDFQEYSDWVELYNSSNTAVDLSGWMLSDDADTPDKWLIPAGVNIPANGFLLIWADGQNTGLHAGFKLSAAGEKVILSRPDGTLADRIDYLQQLVNTAYGRQTDGSGTLGYFNKPTPGASNNTSVFFEGYVTQAPVFSVAGGFFDAPVTVNVFNHAGSGTLRYTTDGSVPGSSSPEWQQALQISTSTVVKARIFMPNRLPGPVVTNTYFIQEDFAQRGLSVLSISAAPDYFYSQDSGILVQNYKPLWEIPVHLEMYENDGLLAFHHDAGASVGGENSWQLPQKMFNISSRKEYGGGAIAWQVFPESTRNEYSDIILRTSGNDWSNTLFRDAMMQGAAAATADLDIQPIRPVAAFINGVYYGIYNMREKQDKDYLQFHHGIDPDSLDYIENDAEIKEGDAVAYTEMTTMLANGVQSNAAFAALDKVCDTRDYTDYMIAEIFCANTSWGHNIALFRKRSPDARWRWLLHDFDRGFNLGNVGGVGLDWFTTPNGTNGSNSPFGTLFLRKMLENNDFKSRFITRFADHLFITWNPQALIPRIDRHAARIRNEVPHHVDMWAGTTSNYGDGIPSVGFWENEVNELRTYATQRNAYMWTDLSSFFSLNGASALTVQVNDPAQGHVRLHEMNIPTFPWSGKYLNQQPFTLTAEAKPGFNFVRWEKSVDSSTLLLPGGDAWRYSDATTPPAAGWREPNFDDAAWSTGNAEFGYGDNDETTVLEFGDNGNQKTISYYFRKKFNVQNPAAVSSLLAKMVCDDGAVVYLNGQEVWRYNLPAAPQAIDFSTLANTAITNAGESTWNEQIIPANLLQSGENLIAVEVHQSGANSSDLSFNFELDAYFATGTQTLSTNPVLDYTIDNAATVLRAVFESDGSCGVLADTIRQNTTLFKSCSPYRAAGNVVVQAGVSLTIEPGVEIQLPESAELWVLGDIQAVGTENDPILFVESPGTGKWAGIFLKKATATSNFSHVLLRNASAGKERFYYPAAISAYKANVNLEYMDLTAVLDNPVFSRFSDVSLSYSHVRSVVTGDGINIKQGHGRVENCTFSAAGVLFPDMDAIDFDGVSEGVVRNNVIHDFRGDNCDGLDIGEECHNLLIENNFIYHCFDKGISVGQQSSATIQHNTIAYTNIGIALKDQSPVTIDHCTIFGTQNGVSAYEKNPGSLGGNGTIRNTIVSNTAFEPYIADALSSIALENCLSGDDSLDLTNGNFNADPHFFNPTMYDFRLLPASEAIGAATDGSNLGPATLPVYTGEPQVLITEILYDDSLVASGEFLEIHNPGTAPVDLGGYILWGALDFVFPAGTSIAPGEYLVVVHDAAAFSGAPYQVFEWTTGKLADEGEKILLTDATGVLVDFVRYNNHAPWPERSELQGRSLELRSTDLDNHFASSWKPSALAGGTPGAPASSVATFTAQEADWQVYPNPVRDWLELPAEAGRLRIFGLDGQLVAAVQLNGQRRLDVSSLPQGVYLAQWMDAGVLRAQQRFVIAR